MPHARLPLVLLSLVAAARAGAFERGTSNIEWCEHTLSSINGSAVAAVAEPLNSASNAVYAVAALAGLRRARARKLPAAFWLAELLLVVVGFGSALFHATRSYAGELLDELPMSCLAAAYLFCTAGTHALSSGRKRLATFGAALALAGGGWAAYLLRHDHDIFALTFTLQVLVPALLSFAAGRARGVPRGLWWAFLVLILLAKAVWELERALWRRGQCEAWPALVLAMHPLWHLGSATAHGCWMAYAAAVVDAVRRKRGGRAARDAPSSPATRQSPRVRRATVSYVPGQGGGLASGKKKAA